MDEDRQTAGCCHTLATHNDSSAVNVGKAERAASTAAGVVLVALGLRHIKSLSGAAAAVAGAGLLYRGLSGHCSLYQALGIRTNVTGPAEEPRDFGSDSQPSWSNPPERKDIALRDDSDPSIDVVQEASDESFPASDPPAWTATTASKNHSEM